MLQRTGAKSLICLVRESQYQSAVKAIKSVCSGFIAVLLFIYTEAAAVYLNKQKRNALVLRWNSDWSRAVSRQRDVCVNGKSIGVEFPSSQSHTILVLAGCGPGRIATTAIWLGQPWRILTFKVRGVQDAVIAVVSYTNYTMCYCNRLLMLLNDVIDDGGVEVFDSFL
jgi:hypothetical protein